jgi:hypothetical protein
VQECGNYTARGKQKIQVRYVTGYCTMTLKFTVIIGIVYIVLAAAYIIAHYIIYILYI